MQPTALDLSQYAPEFEIKIAGQEQNELRQSSISLEVNEEIGNAAQFTLVVADRFDIKKQKFYWLNTFLSDESPLFDRTKKISVSIGYAGKLGLVDVIEARLENVATSGFSGDITQITLSGYDNSFKFLTEQSTGTESTCDGSQPVKVEKNDTYDKVAEKLAKAANLDIVMDSTKAYSPITLKKSVGYVDFLKDVAKRVGYEFYISRGVLYFVDPRKKRKDQDTIPEFKWGTNLVQFSPSINTAELVKEVEIRGNLPDSKKKVVKNAVAGSEDLLEQKEKGQLTGSELAEKLCKKKVEITDRNFHSEEEAEHMAKAELNRISDQLITGSASVVGDPDLSVGKIVSLQGLGLRLSGLYYITGATHKIDDSGFTTSFNVRKNII